MSMNKYENYNTKVIHKTNSKLVLFNHSKTINDHLLQVSQPEA